MYIYIYIYYTYLDARGAVVAEAEGHVEVAVGRVLQEEVGQLGNLRARTHLFTTQSKGCHPVKVTFSRPFSQELCPSESRSRHIAADGRRPHGLGGALHAAGKADSVAEEVVARHGPPDHAFDHPLFLITYPYISHCMGARRVKG